MMTPTPPSIFNDVLGPVMRGPSSSHSAAANRIAHLCRDLVGGDLSQAIIEYDPNGSLVTTHKSQGTDMGLYGGFLGWSPEDPRLTDYLQHLKDSSLQVEVKYLDYGAQHPNTYRLTLRGIQGETHSLQAISTGGGMIEVQEIDHAPFQFDGGSWEILLFLNKNSAQNNTLQSTLQSLAQIGITSAPTVCQGSSTFLRITQLAPPEPSLIARLASLPDVQSVRTLKPVLPILTHPNSPLPFQTVADMLTFDAEKNSSLWELAVAYESARGRLTEQEIFARAREILQVMDNAVRQGLAGTQYHDRILPCQSVGFMESHQSGKLIPGDVTNRMIAYVSAILEVKSSMGVIVAAPTAGSCGAMPGTLLAVADTLKLDEDKRIKALLAAGLIGVFIATHATFAAEVGGCMAECGSGAGMAAAALVGMAGGSLAQQLSAASVALQNSFGMTCDPIANRVEAPCLGKNVLAGSNAIACANMALANYKHLIPLDEVIHAMREVGHAIPHELRCTAKGGLSICPTSQTLEKQLNSKT